MKTVFQDDKKGVACDPCRKSHVRCDRVKPACGVCTRRGIQNRCYGAKSNTTTSNIAFVSHATDTQANQLFPSQTSSPASLSPHSHISPVSADNSIGGFPSTNPYSTFPQSSSVPPVSSSSPTFPPQPSGVSSPHLSHSSSLTSSTHSPHLSPHHGVSSPLSPHANSSPQTYPPLSPHATASPLSPHAFPHGPASPNFATISSTQNYPQVSPSQAPYPNQPLQDYYSHSPTSFPQSPTSFPHSPQFPTSPNFSPSVFTSSGGVLSPPLQLYTNSPSQQHQQQHRQRQQYTNDTQSTINYSGNLPYYNTPDASLGSPQTLLQFSNDAAFINSNNDTVSFTYALESDGPVTPSMAFEENLMKIMNNNPNAALSNAFLFSNPPGGYVPPPQVTSTPLSPTNYSQMQQFHLQQVQSPQQPQNVTALPPLSPVQSSNDQDKNAWWKEGQGQVEKTTHTHTNILHTHSIHSNKNNTNVDIINKSNMNNNSSPTNSNLQNDGTVTIPANADSTSSPNTAANAGTLPATTTFSTTTAPPTATATAATSPTPPTTKATTPATPTATSTSTSATPTTNTTTTPSGTVNPSPDEVGKATANITTTSSSQQDAMQLSSPPVSSSDVSPSAHYFQPGHSPSPNALSSSSSSSSSSPSASPSHSPSYSFSSSSPSPLPFTHASFQMPNCSSLIRKDLNNEANRSSSPASSSSSSSYSLSSSYSSPSKQNSTTNTIIIETPLSNGREVLTERIQIHNDDDIIELPPNNSYSIIDINAPKQNKNNTNTNIRTNQSNTNTNTTTQNMSTSVSLTPRSNSALLVTTTPSKRQRKGNNSDTSILSKINNNPTTEREKDELISMLKQEVERLERFAQNHFTSPYANPSWTQGLSTSLWDAQTGMLVECNRAFYNEYRPRYSPELKSMTLTGQEGVICTSSLVTMLRTIVHTSFVFQPKAHGKGFIMMGSCRIIRGPNAHLVSMVSWEV